MSRITRQTSVIPGCSAGRTVIRTVRAGGVSRDRKDTQMGRCSHAAISARRTISDAETCNAPQISTNSLVPIGRRPRRPLDSDEGVTPVHREIAAADKSWRAISARSSATIRASRGGCMYAILHDTPQESSIFDVLTRLDGSLSGMPRGTKSLPTDAEKTLGSAIYVRMRDAGVSQEAIGDALGISQSQVSRILSGVRPTTLTELVAIAERLGVKVSVLLEEVGL